MLEVVAGVMRRNDQVLIAQRPAQKHDGGLWEFPGGKIEPGEAAHAALARELNEELGIGIGASEPMVSVSGERLILHARRVSGFVGEPTALEHDAIAWVAPNELLKYAMPVVDRPVRARLLCGPRWLITPEPTSFDVDAWLAAWLTAFDRADPPDLISVRLKSLREPEKSKFSAQALAAVRAVSSALVMRHCDTPVTNAGAFDGVHFSQTAARAVTHRPLPPSQLLAISTHDASELDHAQTLLADLACLGPVQRTASHPDTEPLGWDRFQGDVAARALPVYALGGVGPHDVATAITHGAHGVAAIRQWSSSDSNGSATVG